MAFSESESYRIINVGDETFESSYSNVKYRIPPKGETFVPFGAVDCWLGNPNAVDRDETHRERFDVYQHLLAKYGAHENHAFWDQNKPKLECYTLRGERVVTVVDDPEGDTTRNTTQTEAENVLMQDRMQALEQELAAIRQQQQVRQSQEMSQEDLDQAVANDEVTEDNPQAAGVGSAVPWMK